MSTTLMFNPRAISINLCLHAVTEDFDTGIGRIVSSLPLSARL